MKDNLNKRSSDDLLVNKAKKVKKDSSIITFKEAKKVVTNWTFKARVTNKTEIKSYANGNLFSFDLIDSSGEIRCIIYLPFTEIFFEKVVVNKVYLFSNVLLKASNKTYNHFDNLFELNLHEATTITEYTDIDVDIPLNCYNFINLLNISDYKRNDVIDVIGIISNIGSIEEISNNKGVKFIKREVELSDEIENKITLIFWRSVAVDFSKKLNSILIVKGGKINELNNVMKLSIISTTIVTDDIFDVPEGERLQEYLQTKHNK